MCYCLPWKEWTFLRSFWIDLRWCSRDCAEVWCIICCSYICWGYAEYLTQQLLMTYPVSVIWKISSFVDNCLEDLSWKLWFSVTPFILINNLYKLNLYTFMCIYLVPMTRDRASVALIPWNLTLHQRHFYWLFSSFSMWLSSQKDDIELRNSLFTECDGLRLKNRWYFEGELPDGSTMSKNSLIKDEQNYQNVTFGEGYLSITN